MDSMDQQAPTADPPAEFDTYQLVLLRRPPTARELPDDEADVLQGQHLGHLAAMKRAGHILASGPFRDQPDEAYRGMCLYCVESCQQARSLAEADPAVRVGQLEVDVMTWLTPKGSLAGPSPLPGP
jgi:uncharacterized protein YciI